MSNKALLALAIALPPFSYSLLLFVATIADGSLNAFALIWPIFQIAGYAMSWHMSNRRFEGAPVYAQMMIHWILLVIIVVLGLRG